MAEKTSDLLLDRLIEGGVRVVFGLPADGINGVMEALARGEPSRPPIVLTIFRDEIRKYF
ncbi:hypothetical protein A7982_12793 [Minicystis rosea]|nr:hypothetical protein A7982_12793 [Minicystis rosea]